VKIRLDNSLVGETKSSDQGAWIFSTPADLDQGGHLVQAEANGQLSNLVQFIIDTVPPLPPEIIEARLVSTTRVTPTIYDAHFNIRGLASLPDETISFSFDSGPFFKGLSPKVGPWQTPLSTTLSEGDHILRAVAADLAGNISVATAIKFHVPLIGDGKLQPEVEGGVTLLETPHECSDGLDNDNDGAIDYPADGGCLGRREGYEKRDEESALSGIKKAAPILAPILAPIAKVIENPIVQQVNRDIAAPAAVVVTGANAAAALPGLGILSYLRYLFLQPFLLLRRRKGWGTVYNAMTKLPVDLAIVRLQDSVSGRLIRTTVTDRNGRFIFFIGAGSYKVSVTKTNFIFPSEYLRGKKEDLGFSDLYFGDAFNLESPGVFAPNIALDPVGADKPDRVVLREAFKAKINVFVAHLGIILAAAVWFISPTVSNTVALLIQAFVYIAFRRLAKAIKPKTWGIVSDLIFTKPLHNSIVRIFEPTYNRVLGTQVTDSSGRYAFLVGRNKYYVSASRHGYESAKTDVLDLTTGPEKVVVAKNIPLKPSQSAGGPPVGVEEKPVEPPVAATETPAPEKKPFENEKIITPPPVNTSKIEDVIDEATKVDNG
jgi:hypothetical protein